MKVLFRASRFLISCLVSCVIVYLSGYGNLMENLMPDLATRTFLLSSLVIAVIIMLIWEMYLIFRNKINDLTKRIEELEQNK